MKLAYLLLSLVAAIGCADDEKFRHIPDALPSDGEVDAIGEEDLIVTIAGNGSGEVVSHPDGINCTTATCRGRFARNTEVELLATPSASSVFDGWSGACSGNQPTCKVDLASVQNVTATFKLKTYTVTVAKAGAGTGTVSGDGLACGATCSIVVDHGTMLSLAATPAALSVFAGWGGACSGNGTCDLTITHDTTINANFALDNFTLFVNKGGTGAGTVASSPAGISCGGDCEQTYTANQLVTLTATAAASSTFTGWSGGGCTGTGTCSVTIAAATTVTANFTLKQYALDVTKAGSGSGTVSGGPISCGATCSATLAYGTPVTLTATAAIGSTFAGWSGACTGTGTCSVTINAAKSVTATFTLQTFPLTVTKAGSGSGTVSGGGISCGSTCSATFNYGTPVTLTATAATGSTFAGWSGACSGTGMCSVTMDAMKSVTATFNAQQFTVTVGKSGEGTITASGINCGTTCSNTYPYGTTLTFTATPSDADATLSYFSGWSDACFGTNGNTCTITITDNVTVGAGFNLKPNLMFVTNTPHDGNFGGVGGADQYCQNAAQVAGLRGHYLAYLSYGYATLSAFVTVDAPSRFSNVSGWDRVDGAPVMKFIEQMHKGTLYNPPLLTEYGTSVANTQYQYVWTGTYGGVYNGQCVAPNSTTGWAGTSNAAYAGKATVTTQQVVSTDAFSCLGQLRLYCLGIDRMASP